MVRRLVLVFGAGATILMLFLSMRLNFYFGASLGQTAGKAWVFGLVSIVTDIWKALGPICIAALWHARRVGLTGAATLIWLVCFSYSATSAIGVSVEDRLTRTGSRESVALTRTQREGRAAQVETREPARASLRL